MKYHGFNVTGTLTQCSSCALYKAKARPVAKVTSSPATRPGERLFMDTSGPFPMTLVGNLYWIKFKDQYSGMSWNAFTKKKFELPIQLGQRLARLKIKGINVQSLRYDNAGEHGDEVKSICSHFKVRWETTAPNTPQHNGVVERQFATEWSRANAMLEAADFTERMKNRLRQSAIETATLLYNTSCNDGEKSPYEKFFGTRPTLTPEQMIQFGRMAYITDRNKIKSKLKPKAYKCLFAGYALNHSAHTYKFYNPVTNKIIYSRDVKWGQWDDVDPKRSMQAHRREVVDEIMQKPSFSEQQKHALGDLLRHYVGQNDEEATIDEEWNLRRRQGRLSDTMEMELGDDYGSNGRLLRRGERDSLLSTGGLHHFANPHLQGITEVTDHTGRVFDQGNPAPGQPGHEFYPGAYTRNVRPQFNEEYEDIDEMPPLVQDAEPPETQEVPEEEREREITGDDEVEEDETQEDERTVTTQKQPKKRLTRELQNLDTSYNPIRNTRGEVRKLHTCYNPTAGNNEINLARETEQIYSAITSDPGEPTTVKEALSGPDKVKWGEAMKKEIDNFMSRGVWKKVSRREVINDMKRKLITCKWIFKQKIEQDGTIRFKARCVSRGFMQIPGVDYTESFAPVSADTSIRTLIGTFLYYLHKYPKDEWVLEMFDVEAAFLNAELGDQRVFIEWPEGMVEYGFITAQEKLIYCAELEKAMYGNIDSPLRWMKTMSKHIISEMKMEQSQTDPCVFIKKVNGKPVLILALYVDDTLCAGTRKEMDWMYEAITKRFKIEKLGRLKKHLGIWWEWHKDSKGNTYLSATMDKMIADIGKKFEEATKKKAKESATPGFPGQMLIKNTGEMIDLDNYRSIVGKIMYYTTKVAPEISNAARDLASHLSNPGAEHWKALERCVGYITHLHKPSLVFRAPRELRSISLCDSDYAKSEDDRKSISGRINTIGGMITNWTSKKQSTVALSSTESEYQSLSECAQEAMFTQNLIYEITGVRLMAIIYEDNLGAIYLTRNQQVSARTKHIDIRHHYMRDLLMEKRMDIRFIRSEDNSSDICTKNTPRDLHEKHSTMIRDGTLQCWKEDVKTDATVKQYGNDNISKE
jgi:hypothetical protein